MLEWKRMKITKNDIFLLISVSVIVVLTFILGRCSKSDCIIDNQTVTKVDTVFQQRIDTVHLTHTVTKYRPQPTKTDTIFITDTISDEMEQHIQKTYECNSSYKDTTCLPSTRVDYHLYVRTDNYDIDSVSLKFNVDYPKVTQTQTITKTITKKKHWGYGIQTGFGYGIFNRKPDLYVGMGITYNF